MDKKEKEDWHDIYRTQHWHSSLDNSEVADFLGADKKRIFRVYKEYRGKYWKNIIAVSFEDFLAENQYTKVDQYGVGDQDYFFLKKEDIELKPGVFKRCTTEGTIFLEGHGQKFILELGDTFRREDFWELTLFYRSEAEKEALKLLEDLEAFAKAHSYLKGAKIEPNLSHIPTDSQYDWNSVILPELTKKEIQLNVGNLINDLPIYEKNNIKFKRGLILKGVPGTGKTLIGKVICNTAPCTFIWVTPAYLGNSASVKFVCNLARELSPAVLFLEDIDLYGEDRRMNSNANLLGELMNQLDGLIENHYVIVIATTNKVDEIESALRNRPGRFDRILDVPPPDYEGRVKMLELYTKNFKLKGVEIESIAKKIDKYTGAHVRELVTTAVMAAIDEKSLDEAGIVVLKPEHFVSNIEKVRNKKIEPVMGFGKPSKNLSLDDDGEDPID